MGNMKKIAEMFGVELGEKFRLRRLVDLKLLKDTYVFDENGFWFFDKKSKWGRPVIGDTWQFLMTGDFLVEKIEKDRCYVVTFSQCKPCLLDKEVIVFAKSEQEAKAKAIDSICPAAILDAEPKRIYADRAMYCRHCKKGWKIGCGKGYKFCPDCGCRLSEGEE